MYINIIIIKYWFIKLWRLIIPNIVRVNWQAEGPRESVTKFQSESEGLRTRRTDGIVPVQRPVSPRPRKSQCPSLNTIRKEELSLTPVRSAFLFYPNLLLIG